MTRSYDEQLREQIEQYRETEEMHDLPPVFHDWSHDAIRPGLKEVFGTSDINEFYVRAFVAAARLNPAPPSFLSLGCGDGAVEIAIAATLVGRGLSVFTFVCYDLSDILLQRFRAAIPAGMETYFKLIAGDLNATSFDMTFDAIMANHSLHHILNLEEVYKTAYESLAEHGIFVTSDMIGRNGHMRWPETRFFVDFFWPFLSLSQRRNVLLRREEASFLDHDCSSEGFEGIRAQEVLPLLLKQGFHPAKFFGFGGMIDVFVDRCFGPNFDVRNPDDMFLTRRVGLLNDVLLDAGVMKPTMMFAWFTKQAGEETFYRSRSVSRTLRPVSCEPVWLDAAVAGLARHPDSADYVYRSASMSSPEVVIAPSADAGTGQERSIAELLTALSHAEVDSAAAQLLIIRQAKRLEALEAARSQRTIAPLRRITRLFQRSVRRLAAITFFRST